MNLGYNHPHPVNTGSESCTYCRAQYYLARVLGEEGVQELECIITGTAPRYVLVDELELSVRSYTTLAVAGITTIRQLSAMSKKELLRLLKAKKNVNEVVEVLRSVLQIELPD